MSLQTQGRLAVTTKPTEVFRGHGCAADSTRSSSESCAPRDWKGLDRDACLPLDLPLDRIRRPDQDTRQLDLDRKPVPLDQDPRRCAEGQRHPSLPFDRGIRETPDDGGAPRVSPAAPTAFAMSLRGLSRRWLSSANRRETIERRPRRPWPGSPPSTTQGMFSPAVTHCS
jgi:hypothetical protein